MAQLIKRRSAARPRLAARHGDLGWVLLVGGAAALVLGWTLTVSVQAACALVLVLAVIALYQQDRQWGIYGVFALWFVAPGLRRVFGLMTGYVDNDPLSLAPYLATAIIAAFEFARIHVPISIRRILLVAAIGFSIGIPLGIVNGPSSALYAFGAYMAAISGAILGVGEGISVQSSTLRRVLLYGMIPVAVYAILQRVVPLAAWDREWIEATKLTSIGSLEEGSIRVFASLNHPGALAPLLALSLLCYLTIHRARTATYAGVVLVTVALSLTFVRSAWVALIIGAVAHVIVSEGRSARVVFGAAAVAAAVTIALSPVSQTAEDVVNRFKSITNNKEDTSQIERKATVRETLPVAVRAPLGHGLGSAGEATKLTGESELRAADNGYLALMYQVGLVGFLLVMTTVVYIAVAAWDGARSRAPGQEMRQLLFAMLVALLVVLWAGDAFYGTVGVIFWFVAGQVLANDYRRRMDEEIAPSGSSFATGTITRRGIR
jgi:putative inorganic carbon (hco3(-)) transporter